MQYPPPPPPQAEKKDRTLLGVLLAGCGCLFVVGILFVIGAGKFFTAVRGPGRIARSQIEAINIGNYQLAYSYFTADYKRTQSLPEWRNELQEFANLFPSRKIELNQTNIKNDRAIVNGTMIGKDGSIVPIHFELVKEKVGWRIQSYQWSPPGHLEKI
jgi:hypothetical protein